MELDLLVATQAEHIVLIPCRDSLFMEQLNPPID